MKHFFTTKVKTVLIIAVLLAAGLAVISNLTGSTFADTLVQSVLSPLRSGVNTLALQAERIYDYIFKYETLETENAALKQQLSQMEVFTNEQLQAIANVARMCTSYLWLKELISLRGNPTAFAISEYISEHLSESLTVDSLCARFGISKTALYLLSTESFGSGITAYIQQQRIQRAMQMLEDGSHSVGDMADAVGFSDPNYFIKVFKAHTGYTPLRWRNRNTAAEQ